MLFMILSRHHIKESWWLTDRKRSLGELDSAVSYALLDPTWASQDDTSTAIADLDESPDELSWRKLATLKAEKYATKGPFFPVLDLGSKHVTGDKVKGKHRDLHEMESALKELLEQASSRLAKLKGLHEERLSNLQRCIIQANMASLQMRSLQAMRAFTWNLLCKTEKA
ncbi:hypothetical protein REPUB_Repub05bG0032400 [Reevesia pubescens]